MQGKCLIFPIDWIPKTHPVCISSFMALWGSSSKITIFPLTEKAFRDFQLIKFFFGMDIRELFTVTELDVLISGHGSQFVALYFLVCMKRCHPQQLGVNPGFDISLHILSALIRVLSLRDFQKNHHSLICFG